MNESNGNLLKQYILLIIDWPQYLYRHAVLLFVWISNVSNCIHEGGQVSVVHDILNPHDSFTNLAVKWFKADEVPMYGLIPDSEAVIDSQGDYQ